MFLLRNKKDISIFWMKKCALSVAMCMMMFIFMQVKKTERNWKSLVITGHKAAEGVLRRSL